MRGRTTPRTEIWFRTPTLAHHTHTRVPVWLSTRLALSRKAPESLQHRTLWNCFSQSNSNETAMFNCKNQPSEGWQQPFDLIAFTNSISISHNRVCSVNKYNLAVVWVGAPEAAGDTDLFFICCSLSDIQDGNRWQRLAILLIDNSI